MQVQAELLSKGLGVGGSVGGCVGSCVDRHTSQFHVLPCVRRLFQ